MIGGLDKPITDAVQPADDRFSGPVGELTSTLCQRLDSAEKLSDVARRRLLAGRLPPPHGNNEASRRTQDVAGRAERLTSHTPRRRLRNSPGLGDAPCELLQLRTLIGGGKLSAERAQTIQGPAQLAA